MAERTRQKILDAAMVEFGAKGYSGARTAGIAARAGVNQQLIAYYFGGKQGLLDELRRRWSARQETLVPPEATFAESLQAYLDVTLDHLDWARLVVWQALGDDPGQGAEESNHAQGQRIEDGVRRIRDRQRAGELTDSVSAEFIVLLAHMAAFAPVAMPQLVQSVLGVAPGSADYRRLCRDQLATLLSPCEAVHDTLPG
ncbi:TetR/AcrR family transcriptional regulator [Sphaerisporangium sp. TRM90804]|uniref:TetR/AcrR family transcriptional regulator n=1 Tax=Sphaerisporangium sp. TRM90804 TaxID=3031113 RepID=UPI00244CE414|nr:TetR/AcrR family transcriptional regulator [Sphaerisporangium sp. TRM90804]MDH2428288.1 TetR family transcriptional regulator [Sphaerisporangium sp. TRM90804]